jgi:hypothetical protein
MPQYEVRTKLCISPAASSAGAVRTVDWRRMTCGSELFHLAAVASGGQARAPNVQGQHAAN